LGGARAGWAREEEGEGERDMDRRGEKGVPPRSTTHFNHWIHKTGAA